MSEIAFRWVEAEADVDLNFNEYSTKKEILKEKPSALGLKLTGLIGVISNAFSRDPVATSDGLIRLLDEVEAKNAGVLADFAHFLAGKERIEFVVEKLGSRLRYVHLADNDSSDSRHLPLGQGDINFPLIKKVS